MCADDDVACTTPQLSVTQRTTHRSAMTAIERFNAPRVEEAGWAEAERLRFPSTTSVHSRRALIHRDSVWWPHYRSSAYTDLHDYTRRLRSRPVTAKHRAVQLLSRCLSAFRGPPLVARAGQRWGDVETINSLARPNGQPGLNFSSTGTRTAQDRAIGPHHSSAQAINCGVICREVLRSIGLSCTQKS